MNFLNLLYQLEDYEPYIYKEIKEKCIFTPTNRYELSIGVVLYYQNEKEGIKIYGSISIWNVSNVTDMIGVFYNITCNYYISDWDVSNVTTMSHMFYTSRFNGDISLWDVSNVTNMGYMFSHGQINIDLSLWDVSNIEKIKIKNMFYHSNFHGNTGNINMVDTYDIY